MTFYDYLFSHIHYTFSLSIRCQPPSTFATRSHFSLFTMTIYDYFFSSHFHPPPLFSHHSLTFGLSFRSSLSFFTIRPRCPFILVSIFFHSGFDHRPSRPRSCFTLASIFIRFGRDLLSLLSRSSSILASTFFR